MAKFTQHKIPATPPRTKQMAIPYTPQTPQSDGKQKITENSVLSRNSTYVSMITPDFTPKARKRKEMFDELLKERAQETRTETANNLLKREKLSILTSFDSSTNDNRPTTPKNQITKVPEVLEDRFVPHFTKSSPSIRKRYNENLIFKQSPLKKTEKDKENAPLTFNPHKEVLLRNKNGDSLIKQFSKSSNKAFKPRFLLAKLQKSAPNEADNNLHNAENKLSQIDNELELRLIQEAQELDKEEELEGETQFEDVDLSLSLDCIEWWKSMRGSRI